MSLDLIRLLAQEIADLREYLHELTNRVNILWLEREKRRLLGEENQSRSGEPSSEG